MTYPDTRQFVCKYCGRKFNFSAGFNSPQLIDHLLRKHETEVEKYDNLLLSELVKTCYEVKGELHD